MSHDVRHQPAEPRTAAAHLAPYQARPGRWPASTTTSPRARSCRPGRSWP